MEVNNRGGRCHTIYIFVRSDETPLKMCVLDMDTLFGLPSAVVEALGELWGDVAGKKTWA